TSSPILSSNCRVLLFTLPPRLRLLACPCIQSCDPTYQHRRCLRLQRHVARLVPRGHAAATAIRITSAVANASSSSTYAACIPDYRNTVMHTAASRIGTTIDRSKGAATKADGGCVPGGRRAGRTVKG